MATTKRASFLAEEELPRGSYRITSALVGVRSMRGGAQSKLLFCKDGEYYVVKFANNPQDRRVLINEWIVTHLAAAIGLSVPECKTVSVGENLIASQPPLFAYEVARGRPQQSCESGLHFGSLFVKDAFDYLSDTEAQKVQNKREFLGVLCLDKWTCNEDGRQVLYVKQADGGYKCSFIDHGFCFGAGTWKFRDPPLRGISARREVYSDVRGWDDFEPWLSRIESLDASVLRSLVNSIPDPWFKGDRGEFLTLIEELIRRRERVRPLLQEVRTAAPIFPLWV